METICMPFFLEHAVELRIFAQLISKAALNILFDLLSYSPQYLYIIYTVW
jgi:hypothetical protein